MHRKHTPIDERPGPLPEIWADGDSVTYALPLNKIAQGARLVIRCSVDGSVCASIPPEDAVDRQNQAS